MTVLVGDPPHDWASAAAEDSTLAAAELYFMSRPAERVRWRHLLPKRDPFPPPPRWGRKRVRSRVDSATRELLHPPRKEDDDAPPAGRASPTTPLSWSAGSASSSGDATAKDPLGLQRGAFPCGPVKAEAVGGFAGWGVAAPSSKVVAPASRKQGKRKMTVAELRECERSLLERRAELREELEEQRLTQERLMEEHARLRKLEWKLLSADAMKPSASSVERPERHALPFDLNESLSEDPDGMPF